MKELRSEIEIGAAPERVWEVLTDFVSFPSWNPFIRSVAGQAATGARLEVRIEPPGGRAMTFRPTVLAAEPPRELRWLGRLLFPGVFDGEHSFHIEPTGEGGSRFVQRERFSGALVPLFGTALRKTEEGFIAMNEALKQRAEVLDHTLD
jgi:hypothetical protein